MKPIYIVLIGLLMFGGTLFSSYVSANNYGVEQEAQLQAQYKDMENILAQYSLKVTEVAQVPDMYRDDVVKVTHEAISGRYGAGGSKAVFQMLKEDNPHLDVSVYKQIQQVMEAGRNEFQNSQTKFLDMKRQYQASLGYFWQGMWLRMAGFPKTPLDSYKLITSDHATEAFTTGVDKAIKLR